MHGAHILGFTRRQRRERRFMTDFQAYPPISASFISVRAGRLEAHEAFTFSFF